MAKLENLFQIDFGRVWKVLKQLNILLTQWLSNSAPSCLPKRNENIMLPKHLYENSSFTHTSPNLELNQLSINSKTMKQIVIGTHNGIPLNNNKNKLLFIQQCGWWAKEVLQKHTRCIIPYMKSSNRQH